MADALAAVGDLAAGMPLVMAVNREYARRRRIRSRRATSWR